MKTGTPSLRLILPVVCSLLLAVSCSRPTRHTRPPPAAAPVYTGVRQTLDGRVVRIADGDTITVLDANNSQHRVRLQGIDAPESHQDFGTQSKKNLSALIFGKDVTVQYEKTDQYGRLVGKIFLDDRDINLEQIKAGMAWHYKEFEREQSAEDRELYARAEDDARIARRGLWLDSNPMEPSEFRREAREERRNAR